MSPTINQPRHSDAQWDKQMYYSLVYATNIKLSNYLEFHTVKTD